MTKVWMIAALMAGSVMGVKAASFELDASHSTIGFGVKHMVVSTTKGEFAEYTGGFEYDAADPASLKANATIKVASVDTRNAKRDDHLRNSDFFDVAIHPEITFVSTGAEKVGDEVVLTGDLTIKGVTKSIKLPLTVNIQALSSRLWSSGFLSPEHAGVAMRAGVEPVLYLENPPGIPRDVRRWMIDGVNQLNEQAAARVGDPETHARIAQYEMAFRMQASVPDLTDLSGEPASTWDLYGPKAKEPGTFAYNCLMARRMAERGVRFTQIYHRGWDAHGDLPNRMKILCEDIDRPCYGLLTDLKQRGLLDDTLVIWGGEFGRTVYSQGGLSRTTYGRDHHPRCYSMWMAGGGVKGGTQYGLTDDYSYNVVQDGVHIRDLNATILHLLGINHEQLTFKFQGLEQRLTGVLPAHVVRDLLA